MITPRYIPVLLHLDISNSAMSANVHVASHPLVASKLTELRAHDLTARDFREGVKAIS